MLVSFTKTDNNDNVVFFTDILNEDVAHCLLHCLAMSEVGCINFLPDLGFYLEESLSPTEIIPGVTKQIFLKLIS